MLPTLLLYFPIVGYFTSYLFPISGSVFEERYSRVLYIELVMNIVVTLYADGNSFWAEIYHKIYAYVGRGRVYAVGGPCSRLLAALFPLDMRIN